MQAHDILHQKFRKLTYLELQTNDAYSRDGAFESIFVHPKL